MKAWIELKLSAFYTNAIPDIIAIRFQEPVSYESFNVQDVETPAFLRKAFGLKL